MVPPPPPHHRYNQLPLNTTGSPLTSQHLPFPLLQEYALHAVEISVIVAHRGGRLLFSADVSGCWKLHVAVPHHLVAALAPRPASPSTLHTSLPLEAAPSEHPPAAHPRSGGAAALLDPRALSLGGGSVGKCGPLGPLPPYPDMVAVARRMATAAVEGSNREPGGDMELVSVRMVDMQTLKEAARYGGVRDTTSAAYLFDTVQSVGNTNTPPRSLSALACTMSGDDTPPLPLRAPPTGNLRIGCQRPPLSPSIRHTSASRRSGAS